MKKTWRNRWSKVAAVCMAVSLAAAPALAAGETEDDGQKPAALTAEEAAGGVILCTDYPGVSAKPGTTVKFPLYLINSGTEEVDALLGVEELPEGWSGYFTGTDSEVSSVHVGGGQEKADSPKLSYSLEIPENAADGEYSFTLLAEGNRMQAQTQLTVTVSSEEAGQSNFTAEYPQQEGDSATKFSFDTTIINNRLTPQSYSLAAQAPEGWAVTFTPSGESSKVASLPVDAGASQGLTVEVTPSETVEQGEYEIPLTATSSDDTLKLDLAVTITGTYGVTLSTPTGNLSAGAYAGEETKVTMAVTNSGNVDLENLQLAAQGSTDWNIRFDETTITLLEAGATKEVTAYIQPAENAVIGDYVTVMTVSNAQVKSEADLRISIKNHTTWGITAIVVIAAVCICLGIVIRRYGRR